MPAPLAPRRRPIEFCVEKEREIGYIIIGLIHDRLWLKLTQTVTNKINYFVSCEGLITSQRCLIPRAFSPGYTVVFNGYLIYSYENTLN